MKKTIEKSEIEKLLAAHDAVKGTANYGKYLMCMEYKRKDGSRWTGWKFLCWSIPVARDMAVKTIKGQTYLIREFTDDMGYHNMERFTVTKSVAEILGIA